MRPLAAEPSIILDFQEYAAQDSSEQYKYGFYCGIAVMQPAMGIL